MSCSRRRNINIWFYLNFEKRIDHEKQKYEIRNFDIPTFFLKKKVHLIGTVCNGVKRNIYYSWRSTQVVNWR